MKKTALGPYKGYQGTCERDQESNQLHGRLVGLRDVITYQGDDAAALRSDFREAVDDYLEHCHEIGKEPERPFSGKFVLRVAPDVHRRVHEAAEAAGLTPDAWAAEQLAKAVGGAKVTNGRSRHATTTTASPPARRSRRRSGALDG